MFSKLTFLGTSAGCPTKLRNVTSHVVTFKNGIQWMLDCGEGTQHQIQKAPGVKPTRLSTILITHMHGDHVFGLPGLLASMSMSGGRSSTSQPLVILGPLGLKQYIDISLSLTESYLNFPFEVRELDATQSHDCGLINEVHVAAYPLQHAIPCLGYVLTEQQRPPKVDMSRAKALGINGRDIGQILRHGELAINDRLVTAADITQPPSPSRKMVLLGDTCNSDSLLSAGQGASVLVHECTLDASMQATAIANGHSTSSMAGKFARRLEAERLILTHISPRYDSWDMLHKEAQEVRYILREWWHLLPIACVTSCPYNLLSDSFPAVILCCNLH
eukprot:TRINITY_DN4584_c0_g1_i2.p1 TRINITY_DN4584_c0_g1~~TRINITY_DN4584_c0_g1_i2.p1  ORF type:complete len:332 (+),score=24.11 TRINITY_DN4584_c0_g1_i2:34-1029(+)